MVGVLTTTQPAGERFTLTAPNTPGLLEAAVVDSTQLGAGLIVATLAALALVAASNGTSAFVLDQGVSYQLDTGNAFTVFSPLIIASAAGGRWFRKSKAYVVGNFTLWCESYGFGVVGFTPGQQAASSAAEPEIRLNMTALIDGTGNQQGAATDNGGNVWFTCNNNSFLTIDAYKFALADCLQSGTPAPSLHLAVTPPAASENAILAFDQQNGLWLGTGGHGATGQASFQRFGTRAASRANGLPAIKLTISAAGGSTADAQDLVFDGSGNAWVSFGFTNTGARNGGILMLTPAQLAAGGGAVVPTVLWIGTNFDGAGLGATTGMAIAPNNLLWVANYSNGAGINIRAWDLTGAVSGNPAPAVVLTSAQFNAPYWLGFDPQGNLWVQNGNDSKLMRIPAAQLGASGAVVPDVVLNPATTALSSKFTFPNNPDRVGLLPSGGPLL